MKGILARVDEARLGRAVAGLVRRELQVVDVVRTGGELRAEVRSVGKRGQKVYVVGIKVVGRGHVTFCSCQDWRQRGVVCKHVAAVVLHELGAQAHARSSRSPVGLLL